MCGIAGVFGAQQRRLPDMLAQMQARGPDANRVQTFPTCDGALGHVRLSILDLDARSHQPFASPCGRYWLSFNGEIYNYLELREQLLQDGVQFRTESDTEVLLHWMIENGPSGLDSLEGMFAFALLDTEANRLLLARDQIGEKPLYYAEGRAEGRPSFAFASDLNALCLLPSIDRGLNEQALADFLRFLYTPHPNTFYRGVKELPPGCYLIREESAPTEARQYFDLESRLKAAQPNSYQASIDEFRQQFLRSIRLRLQSDVPVGLFLSGGLDSNAILAAADELDAVEQLKAYTVAYDQKGAADGDESELAKQSASHFGIDHHLTDFDKEVPLLETVQRSIQLFGQPYGNATVLVADMISRAAAERSRVCLVGDGGDELLSGYPRHRILPWLARYQPLLAPARHWLSTAVDWTPSLGRWALQTDRLRRLSSSLGMTLSESFLRWTTFLTADEIQQSSGLACESGFYESLQARFERWQARPLVAASLVDLTSFVPCKLMHCADRAGMAHSLELRCPFLAPPLIESALAMPQAHKLRGRRVKPILADAFADRLPGIIKRQPKRPFNPPMRRMLKTQLDELRGLLLGSNGEVKRLLGDRLIKQKLEEFESGRRDHSTLLWGLLVLDQWLSGVQSKSYPRPAAA